KGRHSKICGDVLGDMKLGSMRGQSAHTVLGAQGSHPHEFRVSRQVGQESNRQPAVLEPAAVRSATFRDVHESAENGLFWRSKVSGSSPAFTGVGVKIGVKAT